MPKIQASNTEIVMNSVGDEKIIIQHRNDFDEKGEVIKTSEYFLDATEQEDAYMTVGSDCEDGEGQFVTVQVEDNGRIILDGKDVILWNELCRICANASDKFIPIFSGEGLDHDLQEKIHTYLPVRVSFVHCFIIVTFDSDHILNAVDRESVFDIANQLLCSLFLNRHCAPLLCIVKYKQSFSTCCGRFYVLKICFQGIRK